MVTGRCLRCDAHRARIEQLFRYASVALAKDLGVLLLTFDGALIRKFKPTAVSMRAFCA